MQRSIAHHCSNRYSVSQFNLMEISRQLSYRKNAINLLPFYETQCLCEQTNGGHFNEAFWEEQELQMEDWQKSHNFIFRFFFNKFSNHTPTTISVWRGI